MSLIVNIPNTDSKGLQIFQKVEFFSNLLSGQQIGDISVVEKSSGVKFINFKDSGFYIWDGTNWNSDDDSIIQSVAQNIINIDSIESKLITNRVIVKQASDLVNIDSTKVYIIDGVIDMGNQSIEVPSTGLFIKGLDYFISGLFSNQDNYTMFINKTGEASGNVRIVNLEIFVSGVNSRYFNLDNQLNFGSFELVSCNLGRAFENSSSLGSLSNYRQFRTDDFAGFSLTDGLEFIGTWSGGFSITGTILLFNNSLGLELFKEGANLIFEGSSTSNLNALGVQDDAVIFNFQDSNFSRDEGFILEGARFKIGANPIPNMSLETPKKIFKNCSGIKNTFPGGRWEVTAQIETILSGQNQFKALGTTIYDDLVHFIQTNNNEFIYNSEIEKDFIITGQLVVEGGADDEIDVIIRKFNNSTSLYENTRIFTRNISNLVGGVDVAYYNPYTPVTLNKNDRIEVWLRNNSDNTNATLVEGSFLAINVRN